MENQMKQSEVKLWSLLHVPDGPLASHLDMFARDLLDQRFCARSIHVQVRLVAKFSLWLKARHVQLVTLSDVHVDRFSRQLKHWKSPRLGALACLRRLMAILRLSGAVGQESMAPCSKKSPIQEVLTAYGEHLGGAQALSRATCVQYLPFANRFLTERFKDGCVDLAELRAADVVDFIGRQAACLSPARAKSATIALRSFLRYLRLRGEVTMDLAAAVPTVPNWSMTGIPRAISEEHVRAVLENCRRDTAGGCRDYAILLLLARLGLRSGEIVSLTLDSIDWERGCVTIVGSKGGQRSELPLPQDVGRAIAQYLHQWRPHSTLRALFLRLNAPVGCLGSSTSVGSIVGAAIARAKVRPLHAGAHQFRHALACQMLRNGASLTEIGSLLRHQHQKTTAIYAKVDFAALRPLGLAWPGSAR